MWAITSLCVSIDFINVSSDLCVRAHYLSWPRRKASITSTVLELGEPAAVFPCCIAAGCSPETETSTRRIIRLYYQRSGDLGMRRNVMQYVDAGWMYYHEVGHKFSVAMSDMILLGKKIINCGIINRKLLQMQNYIIRYWTRFNHFVTYLFFDRLQFYSLKLL